MVIDLLGIEGEKIWLEVDGQELNLTRDELLHLDWPDDLDKDHREALNVIFRQDDEDMLASDLEEIFLGNPLIIQEKIAGILCDEVDISVSDAVIETIHSYIAEKLPEQQPANIE
jgi:hypothetical protein